MAKKGVRYRLIWSQALRRFKRDRYRIFERLGIRSDAELAILAVKHGLADDTCKYDGLPRFTSFFLELANTLASMLAGG